MPLSTFTITSSATLYELQEFCLANSCEAVIDGDRMIARVFLNESTIHINLEE